jgi:hypothetical protein
VDGSALTRRRWIITGRKVALVSLLIFWLALIAAGVLKGYRDVVLGITDHQRMMVPVFRVLHVFAYSGIGVLIGLAMIAVTYLRMMAQPAWPVLHDGAIDRHGGARVFTAGPGTGRVVDQGVFRDEYQRNA